MGKLPFLQKSICLIGELHSVGGLGLIQVDPDRRLAVNAGDELRLRYRLDLCQILKCKRLSFARYKLQMAQTVSTAQFPGNPHHLGITVKLDGSHCPGGK
ncbi:hypothetical protein D3C86_1670190 [compost metagenome]